MRTARKRDHEQAIASFGKTRKTGSLPLNEKRTTHYGNVLRSYREKAGMDQGSVGREIGYSTNTISNWENGVSRPDIDAVPKLCALLGIPLTVFFGIECDPASPAQEQQLLTDYRTLPARRKKLAAQFLRQMSEDEKALQAALQDLRHRRSLPHQPLSAAAGVGVPMEEDLNETHMMMFRDTPLSRRADEVFTVNGRSMEPDFPDGSLVYVRHTDRIKPGEVGIFRVSGALMIKEYQQRGLKSRNPAFRMIRPTDDDRVECIGLVLGPVPPEDIC